MSTTTPPHVEQLASAPAVVLRGGLVLTMDDQHTVLEGADVLPVVRSVVQAMDFGNCSQVFMPLLWEGRGIGALVLVLYRKQIVAALQRSTQNPLVEAIQTQSAHFAENNRLFQALGPALVDLRTNTSETATHLERIVDLLTQILAVQRGIKEELIRGHKP